MAKQVDHSNIPYPVAFEEINSEAFTSLNPTNFKGLRVNYSTAFFDKKFYISSMIGPEAHYEFGAYYFNTKLALVSNVATDGRLTARMKAHITDKLIVKAQAELTTASRSFTDLVTFEYIALNYKAQFQLGSNGLTGATYIQRVTPRLSLGGELFWASVPQKSGVGYAARYETDKMVASAQVSTTGPVLLTYVHKVSKKVSLATDFVYNYFSRDVKASVGYDYISRQSHIQGKIDSNGIVSALLEKRLTVGLECHLSASLDHNNKDYKLGFGLTYG